MKLVLKLMFCCVPSKQDAVGHGKASEVRMGVEAEVEVEVEEAVILLCTRLDEVECTRTIIT